jgi:hypothetical protein
MQKEFQFTSSLWLWNGQKGSWYFLPLPVDTASEIKSGYLSLGKGFGTISVIIMIGSSIWQTTIFPDSKNEHIFYGLKLKYGSLKT